MFAALRERGARGDPFADALCLPGLEVRIWGVYSLDVGMGDGGLQPYLFLHSARLPGEDWLDHACLHRVKSGCARCIRRRSGFLSREIGPRQVKIGHVQSIGHKQPL